MPVDLAITVVDTARCCVWKGAPMIGGCGFWTGFGQVISGGKSTNSPWYSSFDLVQISFLDMMRGSFAADRSVLISSASIHWKVFGMRARPAHFCCVVIAVNLAAPAPARADAANGERLARHWCASCHAIGANAPESVQRGHPPSFRSIVRGGTGHVRTFLTMHPPDLSLSQTEIDDLIAYIEKLRWVSRLPGVIDEIDIWRGLPDAGAVRWHGPGGSRQTGRRTRGGWWRCWRGGVHTIAVDGPIDRDDARALTDFHFLFSERLQFRDAPLDFWSFVELRGVCPSGNGSGKASVYIGLKDSRAASDFLGELLVSQIFQHAIRDVINSATSSPYAAHPRPAHWAISLFAVSTRRSASRFHSSGGSCEKRCAQGELGVAAVDKPREEPIIATLVRRELHVSV
jgi:mono/diheme cytochrome c family protein